MVGHKLHKTLLTTVAACAMVLGAGINSASAATFGTQNFWNLNLSIANGVTHSGGGSFSGLMDRGDINNVNLDGFGFISQDVVGGVAVGNPFTESGFLNINGTIEDVLVPPNLNTNNPLVLGDAGSLYFKFDNLTGDLNLDGSITFDPGMGTIRLILDSDGNADPTDGDILELAAFTLVAPSGGSKKDFFGGNAEDSNIAITLVQISELGLMPAVSALFTDENGDGYDLNDPFTLHLGNVNAQEVSIDDSDVIAGMGTGTAEIIVQNGGQYNIRTISEPSSMAALGFGLLGLMGMASRRRRKTA